MQSYMTALIPKVQGVSDVPQKKYAIYKAETGYNYFLYCDTEEMLEEYGFAGRISPEQLPVVLDGDNGFFRFTPNDYGFVEIIESDKEVPLPLEMLYFKNDPNFKLGWMSPMGDTYSCDFTGHEKAAKAIAAKFFPDAKYPERTLGRAGWIKIIDSWDGVQREHGQYVYSFTGKITSRQRDILFDLGLYYNKEVQRLIEDSDL